MEKAGGYRAAPPLMCSGVLLLGLVAFSCCVAAEFNKAKEKDMKLDGNLCSMPRTPAFGLGVTALVCLSVAQIAVTSAVAIRLRSKGKKRRSSAPEWRPAVAMTMFALSWLVPPILPLSVFFSPYFRRSIRFVLIHIHKSTTRLVLIPSTNLDQWRHLNWLRLDMYRVSFGLATVLLSTASSMNKGQPYGQGWIDGQCYAVRSGVYLGSAALAAVTVALVVVMAGSGAGPALPAEEAERAGHAPLQLAA